MQWLFNRAFSRDSLVIKYYGLISSSKSYNFSYIRTSFLSYSNFSLSDNIFLLLYSSELETFS